MSPFQLFLFTTIATIICKYEKTVDMHVKHVYSFKCCYFLWKNDLPSHSMVAGANAYNLLDNPIILGRLISRTGRSIVFTVSRATSSADNKKRPKDLK